MSTKLYFVRSKLKKFGPYQNVKFMWLTDSNRPAVFAPANELIETYDALDEDRRRTAEFALYELMSLREAEAVRDYLMSWGMHEVTIEEEKLPIPANSVPYGAFAFERWEGSITLSKPPSDWRFPGGEIFGYYDLSLAEPSPTVARQRSAAHDLDDDLPF
jgi:hypothetical protein